MKTLTRCLAALVLTVALVAPASAQTYLTTTTLSAAVTSLTVNRISLTSTSGITAAYCGGSIQGCGLFVDGEYMTVTSIPVAGQVNVTRAAGSGTTASLHASGRTVIIAPQNVFTSSDYDGVTGRSPGGPCTASNFTYLPIVNITNGNVWLCRPGVVSVGGSSTASAWVATNTAPVTYNSLLTALP